MKKRTFTYVLALITIVCLLASSASAAAPDTLNGDTIQRRLTYIHSLATTVKISDSGQAICQGRATLNAITSPARHIDTAFGAHAARCSKGFRDSA